jgi:hypothetical protein
MIAANKFLTYSDRRGYKGIAESKEVILVYISLSLLPPPLMKMHMSTMGLKIELQTAGTYTSEMKHEGLVALLSMGASYLPLKRASCYVNCKTWTWE